MEWWSIGVVRIDRTSARNSTAVTERAEIARVATRMDTRLNLRRADLPAYMVNCCCGPLLIVCSLLLITRS